MKISLYQLTLRRANRISPTIIELVPEALIFRGFSLWL